MSSKEIQAINDQKHKLSKRLLKTLDTKIAKLEEKRKKLIADYTAKKDAIEEQLKELGKTQKETAKEVYKYDMKSISEEDKNRVNSFWSNFKGKWDDWNSQDFGGNDYPYYYYVDVSYSTPAGGDSFTSVSLMRSLVPCGKEFDDNYGWYNYSEQEECKEETPEPPSKELLEIMKKMGVKIVVDTAWEYIYSMDDYGCSNKEFNDIHLKPQHSICWGGGVND